MKLPLQALVVTVMGLAAHLTRPAPAASASVPTSDCLPQSRCGYTCTWAGACDDCNYICINEGCLKDFVLFPYREACLEPI